MDIKEIDFTWDENHPIFASPGFLKSQNGTYGYFGGFSGGVLKYVLPYVIKKKLIFKYAVFHADTIYIDDSVPDEEKEFLNGVVKCLKKMKVDFVQSSPSYSLFNEFPERSVFAPFGTYLTDLTLPEEDLWNNLHQKHRNVIRNAIKNGVEIIRTKSDIDFVYDALIKTLDRSGMGFSGKDYFRGIVNSLGDNIEIFSAYKDEIFQGCAVIPFSGYSAYYLWGGSSEKPFTGAMNLLQWEAMKYFKSRGIKQYNFVGARLTAEPGSKLEGIQRFKSRFGTVMKTGYLWKMPLNPIKYQMFNLLIKIKNFGKGPSEDIIDQERKKAVL